MNPLTHMTVKLTVLASIVGSGALMAAPALADNHLGTSNPSNTPQQPGTQPQSQQPGTQLQQPGTQPQNQQPETRPQQPGAQQPNVNPNQPNTATTGTIVDVASSNSSFSTLVQAAEAAGLVETLSGEGPYTVFAPTNEAFNQLPPGALDYLLQPENQDLLRQVLTYHVVPGEVPSSEITTGRVQALGGGIATRVAEDGRVIVNNASVVSPDIQASNGVIHTVNRVLLPDTLQRTLASRLDVQSIY